MARKLSLFTNTKLFTIRNQLAIRKKKTLFVSIGFSVIVLIIILTYGIIYNISTKRYMDNLASARVLNSGRNSKEITANAFENCLLDMDYFETDFSRYDINNGDALDITKLNSTLSLMNDGYFLEDIGVIFNNTFYFNETNHIEMNQLTVEKNIFRINDDLFFIVPSNEHTDVIDGIVGKISISKIQSIIQVDIYDGESSIILCDTNGDILIAFSQKHSDQMNVNCFEDIRLAFSEELYNGFVSMYNTKGETTYYLNGADIPCMVYKNEFEVGGLVFLFQVPRAYLVEQISKVYLSSIYALYSTLIVSNFIIVGLYLFLKHVTQKRQREKSYSDKTGLLTEQYFFHDCIALQLRDPSSYGMVSMNIKDFQKVNTMYGTELADEFLKVIGDALSSYLNEDEGDLVGYHNADNFLLLLKGCKEEVEDKILNVKNMLELYEFPQEAKLFFTFGVKMISEGASTDLRHELDCANYAERRKRAFVPISFYDDEITRKQKESDGLISRFEDALTNHEFEVFLQLKWDLENNEWGGAEALVRWRDPDRGLISPGLFIPLFEENGYITKLDFYVFEETCKMISSMLDNGEKCVPVSINLSKRHFVDLSFIKTYYDITNKYKIPYELIQFEITEGLLVENIEHYQKFIEILHMYDYTISMDDFGAGYSSLNLIHQLNFDVIKIDSRFFRAGLDDSNKTIVESIVSLCHKLNKKVVAEGVEESFEVEFLRSIGCDYIQGYYYAKPLPFNDFKKLYLSK